MRYIKKIESIPLVDGGKVINSFGTNDDHKTNAPSIASIEERTDNNLLINGWFPDSSLGWEFTKTSTVGYITNAGPNGYVVGNGCTATIYTPSYKAADGGASIDQDRDSRRYSISVYYKLGSNSIANPIKVGSLNNITRVGTDESVIVDDNGFMFKLGSLDAGTKSVFTLANNSGDHVWLIGIKIEFGSKFTPISQYGKDAGISDLLSRKLNNYKYNLLPNGTDLNNFYNVDSTGWWMVDTDHYSYSNLPDGYHGNGFLELASVGKSATTSSSDGNEFLQILHDRYCRNVYIRRGWGTDTIQWVPWQKYSAGPKIMKWGAPSAVISAHMSTNIQGPVEMSGYTDGYTAKGVVSVLLQGDVCLTGFDLFNDPNDNNKRKVRIFVFNPSDADVLVQPQVGILYDTV